MTLPPIRRRGAGFGPAVFSRTFSRAAFFPGSGFGREDACAKGYDEELEEESPAEASAVSELEADSEDCADSDWATAASCVCGSCVRASWVCGSGVCGSFCASE